MKLSDSLLYSRKPLDKDFLGIIAIVGGVRRHAGRTGNLSEQLDALMDLSALRLSVIEGCNSGLDAQRLGCVIESSAVTANGAIAFISGHFCPNRRS